MDKQQEIIDIQNKIIDEYEKTLIFLNKVCFSCVEHERKLHKEGNPKYNFELMDFASSTNDCIVDMPRVRELKDRLKDLKGENQ